MDRLNGNEQARRRFWTRQMDEAYAFMETILHYPVVTPMANPTEPLHVPLENVLAVYEEALGTTLM